jgi:hypothetical protein
MTLEPTFKEPLLQELPRTKSIRAQMPAISRNVREPYRDVADSAGMDCDLMEISRTRRWSTRPSFQHEVKRLYFKQKLLDDVIKSCLRSYDDFLLPLAIPHSSSSDFF